MAQFYTGSYGHKGEPSIRRIGVNFEQGTWTTELTDTQAECPSYLLMHPNGKILYAVRELTEDGGLYTFLVEENSLCLISELPTYGKDPCHISLDDSKQFLLVTNYSGSSLAVYRLNEQGIPVKMTDHVIHSGNGPHPVRQETAHPHCSVFAHGCVYVCDLGMDCIFRYKLDEKNGKLIEDKRITMPPGSGPRHLCISDNAMYVVGELASKVFVLQITKGNIRIAQEISTLPSSFHGENIAAAIKLSEDGTTLFVSNRGDDSIAAFRILSDGMLELADVCKTGGKTPRDFSVFGTYLVAANQDSDTITLLEFDNAHFKACAKKMNIPAIRPTQILGR